MSGQSGMGRMRAMGGAGASGALAALLIGVSFGLAPAAYAQTPPGSETVSIKSGESLPSNTRPGGDDPQMRANPPETRTDNLGGGIPAAPATGASPGGKAAMAPRETGNKPASGALGAPGAQRESLPGTGAGADTLGWAVRGLLALLSLPAALWVLHRPRRVNAVRGPGFEVITPSERRQFIPLEEKVTQLDFVSRIKMVGSLRLSANLNKVGLSNRRFGYLMEDKNFRNALLVNRRRVRRTLLKDGDVLDLGDLTLLYRDNRNTHVIRQAPVTPPEGKANIKFERMRGPVRRGTPMLSSESQPNRVFYITANLVFIGRSEDNDLIIKSQHVQNRHAKIERVGSRYKLQDLSMMGNTFVNNRRVEQRYLREGDEIAIDAHRFKFGLVSKPLRERPHMPESVTEDVLTETEDVATVEENFQPAAGQDAERAQS
jgi:pSer/pThr/pTyr-binding forkhead associated (FHA) protein